MNSDQNQPKSDFKSKTKITSLKVIWNQNHFFSVKRSKSNSLLLYDRECQVSCRLDMQSKNTCQPPMYGVKLFLATMTNSSILQEINHKVVIFTTDAFVVSISCY